MITRRLLPAFALLLLIVPASASAAKDERTKLKPSIAITPVARVGTNVSPSFGVVVAAFNQNAAECKGKVALSAPIGKKTIKKNGKKTNVTVFAKKNATIKRIDAACVANGALKLPATLIGKTVKVSYSFKGNKFFKPFAKSKKFVITEPVIPPAPPSFNATPGNWIIQEQPAGASSQQWKFIVGADGTVAQIQRLTSLDVSCNAYPNVSIAPGDSPFDNPFKIATNALTASDTWTDPTQPLANTNTAFNFSFDSASHATGTFRLTGTVKYQSPAGAALIVYSGCDSGVINFVATPGQFM